MRRRFLWSIAVVTIVSAVSLSAALPAGTPLAASMVLDTPDFAHGGVIVSEGKVLDPSFPRFPASSSYSREFRNVALGRAMLITLESNAAVAKRAGDPAKFMSAMIAITRSQSERKAFVAGVISGLPKVKGKAPSANLLRARVIHVGDSAVEFHVRIRFEAEVVEVGEVWVQVGRALGFVLYVTTGPPVTAGGAVQLAGIAARHMALTLEPAPTSKVVPAVSGSPQLGQLVTTTTGTWIGTKPQFLYQWLRCDPAMAACSAIPAATSSTYTITTADQGLTLVASVTAITRAGTANARSLPTPTVL